MKKFLVSAALMLAAVVAGAQVVNVGALTPVQGIDGSNAIISPDGTFVVLNTDKGLDMVDLATGATKTLADGNMLYNVRISQDGSQVVYNRAGFDKNHLRKVSLESVNTATGKVDVIVKPTRLLNSGIALAGNTVNAVENGKLRARSLDGTKAQRAPIASINYGHLDVTVNGKTVSIDPQGRGSYIWPSISPDGTRVLYRLVGKGTFTCNLDGSDVRAVGNFMYPVWAGNDVVVAVREHEGHAQVLTASELVAVDATTGAVQDLTGSDIIVTAPSATADGGKIAFTDTKGALYIMEISK